MGYSFYFDKWDQYDEEYTNLTQDVTGLDKDELTKTEHFQYWLEDNYSEEDVEAEDLIDEFMESNAFWELQDTYVPIYNIVHVLQRIPFPRDILMVYKLVGNVSIIHMEELDVDVIALTGCGMDLSDNIELAYYIIDGVSPIKADQVMSLSKNAEKILYFCRDVVKETTSVSIYEINQFIEQGYTNKKNNKESE